MTVKPTCKRKYLFKPHIYNNKNLSRIFHLKFFFQYKIFYNFLRAHFRQKLRIFFLLPFALFGAQLGNLMFCAVFQTIKLSFFFFLFFPQQEWECIFVGVWDVNNFPTTHLQR